MINKNIDEIGATDLQSLIDNEVIEGKRIEYKSILLINTKDEKKEFLADVSSFANSDGGDLIIGIVENRSTGIPETLEGIQSSNIDQLKLQIENLIRDGISPRIPSVQIHPIQLSNSNYIIVIRVQRSWISPHRVEYGGSHKFYARNSSGKYLLDIGELRLAFNLSETIADRIRRFREERIAKLIANETPVPMGNNPKVVLHLVPINAFNPGNIFDINEIMQKSHGVSPIYSRGWNYRINFDGYVLMTGDYESNSRSYTQLYKNGIIEAVNISLLGNGTNNIPSGAFEKELISAFERYKSYIKRLNINTPTFVFLTLINVKGYNMYVDRSRFFNIEAYPIDRDILIVPEAIIDNYDVHASNILKPCFDAIWNACGWPKSINYNDEGRWIG